MHHAKYNCFVGAGSKGEDISEALFNFEPNRTLNFFCKYLNCNALLILTANYDCLATADSSNEEYLKV